MSIDAVSQPAESNPSVQENRTPDLFNQAHFDFTPETSKDIADNSPAQTLAADIWRDAQNDSEAGWTFFNCKTTAKTEWFIKWPDEATWYQL